MHSKLLTILLFFAASLNIFVSSCRDLTVNDGGPWYASAGSTFNCAWYEETSWTNRCVSFGNDFRNFGLVANDACCTCGGGLRNPTASPSPTTLSLHPTSSPTPGPTYWPTQVPTSSSSPTPGPTYWSYSSSSKRNNDGYIVLILLGTVSGFFLVIGWLKGYCANNSQNSTRSTNLRTRPTHPAQRTPQHTQHAASSIVDERDVRKQFNLSNIIHKKVVTKSSQTNKIAITGTSHQDNTHIDEIDEGDVIFPHEAIIRERSERIASMRLSLMRLSLNHEAGDEEQAGATIVDKKDDICIETLRSIRSSMNIHLDMESLDESLYSPRSCPICCEDYVKDDDVAWSKNEECCHAFHTDCIVPWLMDHDDCPMCRCVYVKGGADRADC